MVSLALATESPRTKRRMTRSPRVDFAANLRSHYVEHLWSHPVLPGETMKDFRQSLRVRLDGIKNDSSGWWLHEYLFFVPIRAMRDWDAEFEPMFTDQNATLTTYTTYDHTVGASHGAASYLVQGAAVVRDAFFRPEEERDPTAVNTTNWKLRMNHKNALHSLAEGFLDSADFNIDLDASGTVTASELEQAMIKWRQVASLGLTELNYDQWLREYGINIPRSDLPEPELLRMTRQWAMPTRIVDPSTGSPANYILWNTKMSSGTKKWFKEPGFLMCFASVVPKVYIDNLYPAAPHLTQSKFWNPPETWAHQLALYQEEASAVGGEGPLKLTSEAYSWDTRDLLAHGDQFLNNAATDVPTVTLTAADKDYIPDADLATFFISDTEREALAIGRANPSILGHVMDGSIGTHSGAQET